VYHRSVLHCETNYGPVATRPDMEEEKS